MILSFKPQFIQKILDGTKLHTLRTGKRRWKVGDTIHFATGVRTKNYQEFKRGTVIRVADVSICKPIYGDLSVSIDGKTLTSRKTNIFLIRDGFYNAFANKCFPNYSEFYDFFRDKIKDGKTYNAKVIFWEHTDKY